MFDAAWKRSWPEVTPVAHLLRSRFPSRWVRFHSLPEAKRYATTDVEHAEILHRHRTVLAALTEQAEQQAEQQPEQQAEPETVRLVAVTCSWSESPRPVPRDMAVAGATPDAYYWRSDDLATEPGFESWQHHYVSDTTLASPELDQLLMAVADDMTAGVLIVAADLSWLYHPYDGGADAITGTAAARDRLAATFARWQSPGLSGL